MNVGEIFSHERRTLEANLTREPKFTPLMPLLSIDTCKHGNDGYCFKCSRGW